MRDARNLKRGLPVYACVKLADLFHVTPMEIIAASELVTAKTEERRALFLPFLQAAKHTHPVVVAGLICVLYMTTFRGPASGIMLKFIS